MTVTTSYSFETVTPIEVDMKTVRGVETLIDPTFFEPESILVHGTNGSTEQFERFDTGGNADGAPSGLTGFDGAVAALGTGRFAAAWDMGEDIAFGVRTNEGASIVDPMFLGEGNKTSEVDVAGLLEGEFVIAFKRDFADGDSDVRLSIRDSVGGEIKTFSVDASIAADQAPSIARIDGGTAFVVAWQRLTGAGTQIWYAVYENDGSVRKAATLLDGAGSINRNVSVATLSNGDVAFVYEDNGWAGAGDIDITLARCDQNGNVLGVENLSNNDVDDTAPTVAALTNNLLVVGSASQGDAVWSLVARQNGQVLATGVSGAPSQESGAMVAAVGLGRFAALFNDTDASEASGNLIQAVRTTTGDDDGTFLGGDDLIDIIYAGGGGDTLSGGRNADKLFGQGGDDSFHVSPGGIFAGDEMHGGAGLDKIESGVGIVDLTALELTSMEALRITGYTMIDMEHPATAIIGAAQVGAGLSSELSVEASTTAPETLQVVLGASNSVDLSGFTFQGFQQPEDQVIILGNGGANRIVGSDINDMINGGGGFDNLRGGGGTDILRGGAGNDIYNVNIAGEARELAGQGIDFVRSFVDYTLGANLERLELVGGASLTGKGNGLVNQLYGNSGENLLLGLGGNDLLNGRGGIDQLRGGLGNDLYIVNAAGEATEAAGQGSDGVRSTVSYVLGANIERLELIGTADISGKGNALANLVYGNGGDNVLNGAGGKDMLRGGLGSDSFLFNTALDPATNIDLILDFDTASDTIRLDDAIFAGLTNAGRAAAFRVGNRAEDASDRIIYNPETGALLFDADGKGGAAAIRFATLDAGLDMQATDFIVV